MTDARPRTVPVQMSSPFVRALLPRAANFTKAAYASRQLRRSSPILWCSVLIAGLAGPSAAPSSSTGRTVGRAGGTLVVAQRAAPRTFNPVTALDGPSRDIIRRTTADLVRIDRRTLETEPELAESWAASRDGRQFTVTLRRGLRFSDGHPCTVDDVIFSFGVYLDERVLSPQRDLLVVGGVPLQVRKDGERTVTFTFAQPYAAAERLFDSIAILPRHVLEARWKAGTLATAWGLDTPPHEMAGLGPYRLKEHVPGRQTVLERNPFYWKRDAANQQLPYVDRLRFVTVPSEDAQVLRFQAGETDLLDRVGPADAAVLDRARQSNGYRVVDLGASLEYNFLLFNLTASAAASGSAPRRWFGSVQFRQAVSAAIDREALVKLVYLGRGTPLWSPVTPGNRNWVNTNIPRAPRSIDRARGLLQASGFHWNADRLVDATGRAVRFSLLTAAGNTQRQQMAAIVQDDLRALGIEVQVVPLEFRALVDRVTRTFEYDACLLGLAHGDADPTADMNLWMSSGATHLWNPKQAQPSTPWEAEIDRLMQRQMITRDPAARRVLFDRVQAIAAEYLPLVPLASPNLIVAMKNGLGNVRPGLLDHHLLWNVEELFWIQGGGTR